MADAEAAFEGGVGEFSIVMSGRQVSNEKDLATLEDAFRRIREKTGMQTCASFGLMKKEDLARLQKAGCNRCITTWKRHVVFIRKLWRVTPTMMKSRPCGQPSRLECMCARVVFSEWVRSWAHRVEMALDLREIDVDSIPINFLNARPGTPLEGRNDLTPVDCLKIIAIYRLILPTKDILICGGREMNLLQEQRNMFRAGANGLMLGNYLTTKGGLWSPISISSRRWVCPFGHRLMHHCLHPFLQKYAMRAPIWQGLSEKTWRFPFRESVRLFRTQRVEQVEAEGLRRSLRTLTMTTPRPEGCRVPTSMSFARTIIWGWLTTRRSYKPLKVRALVPAV